MIMNYPTSYIARLLAGTTTEWIPNCRTILALNWRVFNNVSTEMQNTSFWEKHFQTFPPLLSPAWPLALISTSKPWSNYSTDDRVIKPSVIIIIIAVSCHSITTRRMQTHDAGAMR